jgi:arylsulfate sulfotransferase
MVYLVTSLRLGFDQTGEVRWAYTPDSSPHLSFMSKLVNGNMLAVSPSGTAITEITMLGQIIKTYAVPNAIHHDIIEMPTGNFLVTTSSNNGVSIEDVIVEIDRTSGAIVKTWDLYKILDPSRKALPDTGSNDWLHMNSLFFDASDKSIIFSSRSQSAVVKIDYGTGAVKWILGNPNFWNQSLSKYLFTPVDATGKPLDVSSQDFWPYGQHAASRLQNGNILLYDDGDFRNYYDNANVPQVSYSRAVEYAIDEQAKTIRLVWKFDNNKTQFTPYTGFVQNLSNSNRIIAYMDGSGNGSTGPKIVEIDNNNQILFDADINPGSFYYRGLKVDIYQGIK